MLEFREYLCSLGDRFMGPSQSFKECYFTLLNELFIINFSQGSVCNKTCWITEVCNVMRQMLEFREYLCSLGDRFMGPSQSFKECYFTLLNELFIINFSQGSVCNKTCWITEVIQLLLMANSVV